MSKKSKAKKKNSKWLFSFKINKTVTEEVSEKQEKDGEEVTITKKVSKRLPVQFKLLKPTRKLYDEAELFYGVKMAEGIKAGLLTRQLLAKRYENDGGVFSDPEKKRYADLYVEINECENNYQKLQIDHRGMNRKQIAARSEELLSEMMEKRRELLDIENSRSDIFDQTAENRAKNQVIMWWVLHLAYTNFKDEDAEQDSSWSPLFGEGKYEERLEQYDEVEEKDDDFNVDVIKKFAYLVSFWYMGRAQSREDFEDIEKFYLLENETEEDQKMREEEEAKAEAKEIKESRESILKAEEEKKKAEEEKAKAKEAKKAKEDKEAKKAEVAAAVKADVEKKIKEEKEAKKVAEAAEAEKAQLAELQKAESNKTEEPKTEEPKTEEPEKDN